MRARVEKVDVLGWNKSKGGDAVQLDEVLSKPKLHELGKVSGSKCKGGFAGKVLDPYKQGGSETKVGPDGQRLEWTKTSFGFWMAKPWGPIKGTDGKMHSGKDNSGQFLTWNKGRAYCGA